MARFRDPEAACIPLETDDEEYLLAHTDTFFTERGESTSPAKAVCMGCLAIDRCLDFALKHDVGFGVWGGSSNRERKKLQSTRAASGILATLELVERQRAKSIKIIEQRRIAAERMLEQ